MREHKEITFDDELFLFYSNNPLDNKWDPHPQNPIVSDVRKARSAGNIFVLNDKIYRPSQNCSKSYGFGIKINKILLLNQTEYQEIEVDSIEPNWDRAIKGVHTINHNNRLTIIDGYMKRPRYW